MVTNIFALTVHILCLNKSNQAYTYIAITHFTSNLLLTPYLATLLIMQEIFTETFSTREFQWRSGHICFSAFEIYLLFVCASHGFTLLLSMSRLMVVLKPFSTNFKRVSHVTKVVFCLGVTVSLLTCFVSFLTKFVSKEVSTKFCLTYLQPHRIIFSNSCFQHDHHWHFFDSSVHSGNAHFDQSKNITIKIKNKSAKKQRFKSNDHPITSSLHNQFGLLSSTCDHLHFNYDCETLSFGNHTLDHSHHGSHQFYLDAPCSSCVCIEKVHK